MLNTVEDRSIYLTSMNYFFNLSAAVSKIVIQSGYASNVLIITLLIVL